MQTVLETQTQNLPPAKHDTTRVSPLLVEKKEIEQALQEIERRNIARIRHFPCLSAEGSDRDVYLIAQAHLSGRNIENPDVLQGFYETCQIAYWLNKNNKTASWMAEGLVVGERKRNELLHDDSVPETDDEKAGIFSKKAQRYLFETGEGKMTFDHLINQVGKKFNAVDMAPSKKIIGTESAELHAKGAEILTRFLGAREEAFSRWGVDVTKHERIKCSISKGNNHEADLIQFGDSPIQSPLHEVYAALLAQNKKGAEVEDVVSLQREIFLADHVWELAEQRTPVIFFGAAHAASMTSLLQKNCNVYVLLPQCLPKNLLCSDHDFSFTKINNRWIESIQNAARDAGVSLDR